MAGQERREMRLEGVRGKEGDRVWQSRARGKETVSQSTWAQNSTLNIYVPFPYL